MERLAMETRNITDKNIQKILELFPNVATESRDENGKLKTAIDFNKLKQELSEDIVDGQETYDFTWVGKREAMIEANRPIRKTLRPDRESSVNWDTTENIYIEGDNLDALKLLQESYMGKIKMIYIDPPYNTGNDKLPYRDSRKQTKSEYEEALEIYDDNGYKMFKNRDTEPRFHSSWCSFIFPLIMLSKKLLSDNGLIFISMDEHEITNLTKICDELYGRKNYITTFVWEKGKEGGNDSNLMRSHYEYILCYCNSSWSDDIIALDKKDTSRHITEDKEPNLVKGIETDINKGELFQLINLSKQKDYKVEIPLIDGSVIKWDSYAPQKSINDWIKIGKLFVGSKRVPYVKSYLKDELQGQKPSNILTQNYGTTKAGSIEMRTFFGSRKIFAYPKPSELIKRLLQIGSNPNSIILDFFSGSATTAHAVMKLNAEDGGNRKFIMVQLPEVCDEKSEAYKAGYKNICQIGEERIRRAGEKIQEENPDKKIDIGFRVFKVDDTNMKDVYYTPNETAQKQLGMFESNIKDDRTDEDLLYGCLLDWGVELSLPHKVEVIDGKRVHIVNEQEGFEPDLIACFEDSIPESVIRKIAEKKPTRVVFRDSSFVSDDNKINVEEIFKLITPDTKVKVI